MGGGGRKLNTELTTNAYLLSIVVKRSRKIEVLFLGFSIGIPLRGIAHNSVRDRVQLFSHWAELCGIIRNCAGITGPVIDSSKIDRKQIDPLNTVEWLTLLIGWLYRFSPWIG